MRAAVLIVGALLGACGLGDLADGEDNTPVCAPGLDAACHCATGGPGQQICADDGLTYGACQCEAADAGADAPPQAEDAGPDAAPASASP